MAATVQQNVTDKGVFVAACTTQTTATPATVEVGHLRDATVQVLRTSGSSDTLAITGSNDGTNFAAVTSTQQTEVSSGDGGGDAALTGLTNAIHTVRQKVRYLRFTPSGNTDPFAVTVVGATR